MRQEVDELRPTSVETGGGAAPGWGRRESFFGRGVGLGAQRRVLEGEKRIGIASP